LAELHSKDGAVFEDDEVTGAEEAKYEEEVEDVEEEEQDLDREDEVDEAGNEKQETVSDEDMELCVIVIAQQR